jgi:hypothetical protein
MTSFLDDYPIKNMGFHDLHDFQSKKQKKRTGETEEGPAGQETASDQQPGMQP